MPDTPNITARAEANAILLWNPRRAGTTWLSGAELSALERWTVDGALTGFIRRLQTLGLVTTAARPEIADAIRNCRGKTAPLRSFCAPESLHVELTRRCPLHCPQCYQGDAGIGHLPLPRLLEVIAQAERMKVFQIAFGGGEPLVYPHLIPAIRAARRAGMAVSITTSGTGLAASLTALREAGLGHVQVSLNGSTEAINARSREGYAQASAALRLLAASTLSFGINWVARCDNLADLPEMIRLATRLGVGNLNLLRYKPSPREDYNSTRLCADGLAFLVETMRRTRGLRIKTDSAFSHLLCQLNGHNGFMTGCGAGRRFLALDASGHFRPCSHVPLSGARALDDDLAQYWRDAPELNRFRETEDHIQAPCAACPTLSACRGCRAIVLGRKQDFFAGDGECALSADKRS